MHGNTTVRFSPNLIANVRGNEWGYAGSGLGGFRSMLNDLGRNRIEQITKADRNACHAICS